MENVYISVAGKKVLKVKCLWIMSSSAFYKFMSSSLMYDYDKKAFSFECANLYNFLNYGR